MALESGDLLTLLRRARKATGSEPLETAIPAASRPAQPAQERAATPRAVVDERAELEDIQAELYSDEVLIQRILGLLFREKKKNPNSGFISILDLERTLNIEREGAAFVMSYMKVHKVIEMDDKSRLAITVPGIDYMRKVFGIHAALSQTREREERTTDKD